MGTSGRGEKRNLTHPPSTAPSLLLRRTLPLVLATRSPCLGSKQEHAKSQDAVGSHLKCHTRIKPEMGLVGIFRPSPTKTKAHAAPFLVQAEEVRVRQGSGKASSAGPSRAFFTRNTPHSVCSVYGNWSNIATCWMVCVFKM